MRRFGTSLLISLATLMMATLSAQQSTTSTATTSVPSLIRYGGVLKDAQGASLTSATSGVTFAIYKQQDGGAAIWIETQNVTTDAGGNYSVLLGSTTATGLPGDLFSQQEQRWLGVQVQGEAEQPRVLLVSVPYAFKAHDAETLGGKSISDFVLANNATSAASSSASQTGTAAASKPTPPPKPGTKAIAASDGPTNFSGATPDQIVGVTQGSTGAGVNATAANNAVQGTATASNGYALHGIATGNGGYGVLGESRGHSGTGIGLKGSSSSPSGTGVRGIDTATSGATAGVSGYVNSSAGVAGVFNNAAGGKILSGQNNGTEMFSVDGGGNVNLDFISAGYQIGGNKVLSVGTPTGGNLFVGVQAGAGNGLGTANVFSGSQAGFSNSSGGNNIFNGYHAGYSNTTGKFNTFSGSTTGYTNITGNNNTFYGAEAGYNSDAVCCNVFDGTEAGYNNTSASFGTFLGYQAGYNNVTGSSDVYIANSGPLSGTESNTIRIGVQGSSNQQQNATYIAGIAGATVTGVAVFVDTNTGQLGVASSSRRFKEQIADMGDSTSALMKLRPVTFFYKPEYAKGDRTLQYGLIAEEVAQAYPELVAYDNDGKPYTVRYQYLASMLLNEVQKQYRRAEQQSDLVATQQAQMESQQQEIESLKQQLQVQNASLQERLSRLEGLVRAQSQSVAEVDRKLP
ncbi:MAG: tail fiber domain-containing protein [Candidatus Korobacteraceae bacterium]